jgi:Arc/MetJ family transcription regulator
MRTNIVIDKDLMSKAMAASGLKTMRATIDEALRLYVQIQGQKKIRKLRGRIHWEGNLEESRLSRVSDEKADYKP